jgi:hypothetical protein
MSMGLTHDNLATAPFRLPGNPPHRRTAIPAGARVRTHQVFGRANNMIGHTTTAMHPVGSAEDLRRRFETGLTMEAFLPTARKYADFWQAVWDRSRVADEFVARAEALPGRWHLLVLSADWCGDAVNIVPVLARLAERARNLDLRLLDRDENPDLRDSHLTNGRSASIPVVMILDEQYREQSWWGPRPAALQEWVIEEGLTLDPAERYRRIRRWYAQDRGITTLDEVVCALEEVVERALAV